MRSYLILAPTYYGDMDCDSPMRLTQSLTKAYAMLQNRGMRLDFAAFRYDNCGALSESECALLAQFLQICKQHNTTPLLNLTTLKLEVLLLLWIHGVYVGLHFKECDMPLVRSNICANLEQLYHEIQSVKIETRQHSLANLMNHRQDSWIEGIFAHIGLSAQKCIEMAHTLHPLMQHPKSMPTHIQLKAQAYSIKSTKLYRPYMPSHTPTKLNARNYEAKPHTTPNCTNIFYSHRTQIAPTHNPLAHRDSPLATQNTTIHNLHTPNHTKHTNMPNIHRPPFFVSAHTLDDFEAALGFGIDYATISPIFYDKGANVALGLDFLHAMPQTLKNKAFALGGINTHERVSQIAEVGLCGFASIRYFLGSSTQKIDESSS